MSDEARARAFIERSGWRLAKSGRCEPAHKSETRGCGQVSLWEGS